MSKNNARRPLRLIGIAALCAVLVLTLFPRVKTIAELSERRDTLLVEKAKLEKEQKALQVKLEKAGTPENIERLAREQLGMVKPGEQRLIPVLSE